MVDSPKLSVSFCFLAAHFPPILVACGVSLEGVTKTTLDLDLGLPQVTMPSPLLLPMSQNSPGCNFSSLRKRVTLLTLSNLNFVA